MHLMKRKSLQRLNEKDGERKEKKLYDFSCWTLQSECSLLLCLHVAVIFEPIMRLVCRYATSAGISKTGRPFDNNQTRQCL